MVLCIACRSSQDKRGELNVASLIARIIPLNLRTFNER
jgi:hypothetical protein